MCQQIDKLWLQIFFLLKAKQNRWKLEETRTIYKKDMKFLMKYETMRIITFLKQIGNSVISLWRHSITIHQLF